MVKPSQKKYKDERQKEILSAICALLNTCDGRVEVTFNPNATEQQVHDTLRTIEQLVVEMIGTTSSTMLIKATRYAQQIVFIVKQAKDLVTMKYNFCLPCETLVNTVKPSEPIENVKKILQVNNAILKSAVIGSRKKSFTKGQNLGSPESSNVQYKNLRAEATNCVTLADRIVGKSNKLACYVSAFANRHGGHIYYGITDDGVVNGEVITAEQEKNSITKKVSKTVDRMIWPQTKQKKGTHWDIFFEPVKDPSGTPIPSAFVIVIYVAPCPGGVFVEEPESYHIVRNKVKKMSLDTWLGKLTGKTQKACTI